MGQVKGCEKGIFRVVIRERGSRGISGMAGMLSTKPRWHSLNIIFL